MYAKFKLFIKENSSDIAFALGCIFIVCSLLLLATSWINSIRANSNVNGTVQSIKESASTAKTEIGNTSRKIESAKSANARIGEEIRRSQEAAGNIRKGIGECNDIVRECQAINNEAGNVLDRIGKADKKAAAGIQ